MSIKLNDKQLVLLSAASQRDDHCLVHRFRETNRVPRIYFYRHGL